MNLTNRIERLNHEANKLLRSKKSDTLVLIAPIASNGGKGWTVDICNNYITGEEDEELRQRLEGCDTFEKLVSELDGYATNVPGVRRSNEFE